MSKRNFEWWFNFAASPTGGGLKRLLETASWFNPRGGALFFVNTKLRNLQIWQELRHNQYVFAYPDPIQKLLIYAPYLQEAMEAYDLPNTYFAYGQPLAQRIGRRNWLHISNALTLERNVTLDLPTRVKNAILGYQIIQSAQYVDVYSGESEFTLNLLRKHKSLLKKDIVLAPNGLDNALIAAQKDLESIIKTDAITVGTYSYKDLEASLKLFLELKRNDSSIIKLHIVGPKDPLPKIVRNHPDVICHGLTTHSQLIDLLTRTKAYISSSQIENSSNAALEGLMLCDTIYLSDIPSHRELLSIPVNHGAYRNERVGGRQYLCGERTMFGARAFPTWGEVIRRLVN